MALASCPARHELQRSFSAIRQLLSRALARSPRAPWPGTTPASALQQGGLVPPPPGGTTPEAVSLRTGTRSLSSYQRPAFSRRRRGMPSGLVAPVGLSASHGEPSLSPIRVSR